MSNPIPFVFPLLRVQKTQVWSVQVMGPITVDMIWLLNVEDISKRSFLVCTCCSNEKRVIFFT